MPPSPTSSPWSARCVTQNHQRAMFRVAKHSNSQGPPTLHRHPQRVLFTTGIWRQGKKKKRCENESPMRNEQTGEPRLARWHFAHSRNNTLTAVWRTNRLKGVGGYLGCQTQLSALGCWAHFICSQSTIWLKENGTPLNHRRESLTPFPSFFKRTGGDRTINVPHFKQNRSTCGSPTVRTMLAGGSEKVA